MNLSYYKRYITRWLEEVKNIHNLSDIALLCKKTQHFLFRVLMQNVVQSHKKIDTLKRPKILFIDSTWNDWWGIWDAIFLLPWLDTLWSISELDIMTTKSREVIFNNQKNIAHVITDLSDKTKVYDYFIFLHPSYNKYQYIYKNQWFWGLSRTIESTYDRRFKTNKHVNHIQLIHASISDVTDNLPVLSSYTPYIYLWIKEKGYWSDFVNQYPWIKKICISVGNKDIKKEYNLLYQVIELLATKYSDYTFLLIGDESWIKQEQNIDTKKYKNIIPLSWKFSLQDSFSIIDAADGTIWIDWWLTNASIALWKQTYMIFNYIHSNDIVPKDYKLVTTIDVWCEDKCYYTSNRHICHRNWSVTPQCMNDLLPINMFNNISNWIELIYLSKK